MWVYEMLSTIRTGMIAAGFFLFAAAVPSQADTVHLKNGGSVEGIVEREDKEGVELNLGCGGVIFGRAEVERVERSAPKEAAAIREGWSRRQRLQDELYAELEEMRKARDKERAAEAARAPVKVDIAPDESGQILVRAVVNKKAGLSLVLDTGASLVVLSGKAAVKLGIDPAGIRDAVQLRLGDGRVVSARYVLLESVNVQGVEAKSVGAVILPESAAFVRGEDGLLGMSFLRNFNFRIDHKTGKLALEKVG